MAYLCSTIHKIRTCNYETSRWLLIAALTLYVIHYLLQMIFGFRAKSEDVGTLVNNREGATACFSSSMSLPALLAPTCSVSFRHSALLRRSATSSLSASRRR